MLNEFKLSSNRWQHSFLNYCSTARYFMDAEVSKEIKSSLYENVFQGVIFKSMRHNDLQVLFAHFSFTLAHFQLICSKSTQPYQNCKSFGEDLHGTAHGNDYLGQKKFKQINLFGAWLNGEL